MTDDIKITFYEPWMEQQVIEHFCKQYGNTKEQFTQFFQNFYNHDFQKDKAIKIVAMSGNEVAGFASFCRWDYVFFGKKINSLQCGNVIISENFRGKGVYNRMLNFLNENHSELQIDLLVGFPIKEIVKLYLKSGWVNPFNLSWYIEIINIFSVFFKVNTTKINELFYNSPKYIYTTPNKNKIELEKNEIFHNWHKSYNFSNNYFYYSFIEGENKIEFALRITERKKVLKELIIGDIYTNSTDLIFIEKGFKKLKKNALKTGFISFLSIATNDSNSDSVINKVILNLKFRKIEKDIKFIYKNFTLEESLLSNPKNWVLYRRDLDTW